MTTPNVSEVKRGIAVLWETLQCPICLDLLTMPVSTKCDHQFCKFCMAKLLSSNKQNRANCPVCKAKITKRSLHESPGFQRLVAGLQDMIQAYEHDTGTNYFTGMTDQREDSREADAVVGTQADETTDPDNLQHAEEDLPRSPSSTVAAQNAFERLMGLDNTSPLLTDNEGLDSGLGGVLKQANSPEKLVEPAANKQTEEIPEESGSKRQRRSTRKSSKEEPGVAQQKQKQRQSLEKVAEWLMRVPAEDSLEVPAEEECDSDESDSGSSTSTLDVQVYNRDTNPREDHTKTLEDQVFGAVYKRERRASRPTSLPAFDVESEKRSEEKTDKEDEEEEQLTEEVDDTREAEDTGMSVSDAGGSDKKEGRDDRSRLVPETEAHPPERNAKRRMHSSVQQVDSDLQAQAASVQKKTDKRRGKSVRAPRPLVLVGIQNEETCVDTRRQREEVQVHIENYPSSEDLASPSVRSSRRSRRLQLAGTQAAGRNARTNPPGDKSRDAKQSGEDVDVRASPERGRVAAENGCIYDRDIGGIEHVGSGEKTVRAAEAAPPVDESTAGSSVKDEAAGLEGPDNQDDSEMDTEQLLRSFKGTKRKSFHLGRPNWKRSCSSHEENVHGSNDGSGGKRGKQQATQETNGDVLRGSDHFSCSDLIPPTNSPENGKRSRIDPEQDGRSFPPAVDGLGRSSSSSSALSPNKVSTLHVESPYLSVVPQVVDSGIRFLLKEVGEGVSESQSAPTPRKSQRQISSEEHLLHSDSLTPDGLGLPVEPRAEEPSVHSSINPRKRRKVQRLRSSSESDGNEALPTLTQIFRTSDPHSGAVDVGGDQSGPSGAGGRDGAAEQLSRPPACPSPDCVHSSQASVDLFGTPEECNVPMNGTSVSMEASQFSSEVLVTQQKIEMQKELVRLEKLMALVTEVLQEKEDNPAGKVPSETQESSRKTRPDRCEPDAEQGPDRIAAADGGREGADAPTASNHRRAAEMGQSVKASAAKAPENGSSPSEDKENTPQRDGSKEKMVLVSSGLGPSEQIMVKRFAKRVGARVVSQVTPEVTHVIMYTDDLLVCERTLKYFLGIAGRKWVVSFQWISECFKQKKLLDESTFEVRGDVVNGPNHLGPMRARTTTDNNLLMNGHNICFQGTFTDMTTDEMERMVELCGAVVVKDPLLLDSKQKCHQLVIVQPGSASASAYSSLSKHATVVTRGWLLDTVATYTLQSYSSYVT